MMEWLNVFGLAFVIVLMIPNVVYAVRRPEGFTNQWKNKPAEILEQIGRFGCLACMIVNIPGTWFGWRSDEAFAIYLVADALLVLVYCVLWVVLWERNGVCKALALSVTPAALFLFSGVMSRSILLILFALLFAATHILISCKNAKA